jgi:hypothetical protein
MPFGEGRQPSHLQLQLQLPVLMMEVRSTTLDLWPTRVTLFETPPDWEVNRLLADAAIAAVEKNGNGAPANAAKRRVRGILETSDAGLALKAHLFASARTVLGPWAR